MEESTLSIIISLVALMISLLSFFLGRQAKIKSRPNDQFNTVPLQLQAYERLVVLCERIAIPSLISRTNLPALSAREMQVMLLESVKQEFEYNTSQQIYVDSSAWEAVKNLKDQNMLIINQVSDMLPPNAKGSDLNKHLLDLMISHSDRALHTIVLDVLNHEAKKLMSGR
jgi:hypothetical protein